jgi:hypothetical protein
LVIIWFGVAAGIVGFLVAVLSPSLTVQLVTWALSSLGLVGLWFLLIKPRMTDRTKAGLSREAVVGAIGQLIEVPKGDGKGRVRFSVPLLGSEEWACLGREGESLSVGDRVEVVDILGNSLVVRTKKGESAS